MDDVVKLAAVMLAVLGIPMLMFLIALPLGKAWARRLEGKGMLDPALLDEVEQLRQTIAELQPLPARMAELEERLDFAERLLAQAAEPARLAAERKEI
jgi:Tfp pilus assembly protein PilO